ncbi:hypothetical protein SS50377_26905 [Spironucleus salmonicida]|uniref:Uncharacterized protein n=1 Tax=Spironucleus salmonicida TaxID=348837 RepID=V6LUN5_9EUKA|nr:hypothetical protein SS50377_26905 [Spironucleus salmonicida]|eukprot:EST47416.1 Hypothetical protein SS50377_12401 [Spironucleus salmonicida]
MKHIFPHLKLNFTRAEKRLNQFILEKFPYFKPTRPTVDDLRTLESQKQNIEINFEALQMLQADLILKDLSALITILNQGKQLIQVYFRQLQKDKRQLMRDLKFADNSLAALEFQRNWLPYRPYHVVFRPNFPNLEEQLKIQNDFALQLSSKVFTKCDANLAPEMLYFVDLTRVCRACLRLQNSKEEGDFAAINEEGEGVDLGQFFE